MPGLVRRLIVPGLLLIGFAGLAAHADPPPPTDSAQNGEPSVIVAHAIAMHGEPKYPPDFSHFDYVNPDAPKGGTIRMGVEGSFDSFNPFVARGSAASGSSMPFESLLTGSDDEPFTMYGLIAESIEYPPDRSWIKFNLRPEARWHDGEPITPEDVIFSLEALKEQGAPFFRYYYRDITSAEKTGTRQVKMTFSDAVNLELPLIAGQMPILPKHWWAEREFGRGSLDPPLGSGPYRIGRFEAGRFVELERVEDYWGQDLPARRGQYNFDRIRYDYFFDITALREALKSGTLDYRNENQAKAWAVDYDIPATRRGHLRMEEFEHDRPAGLQAFVINNRRPLFRDPLVRKALTLAFDFEWTNRNLFFGQYERSPSYFTNSEMAAVEPPTEAELAILEPFRGRVPDEVFSEVYRPPVSDGSGWTRGNLLRALELLEEAGWVVRDMQLVNEETGQPFRFEFLLRSKPFERIVLPYRRNLQRLGIDMRVRLVDDSQFINRVRSFDFDMIVGGWGQSESPGNEQRDYWTSTAAERPGSRNHAGMSDPAIDELVELLIAAPDRESLVLHARALDRVLQWNHFVVPNWHVPYDRILFWDRFGFPMPPPRSGTSITHWWLDAEKAERLERERRGGRRDTAAVRDRSDG